LFGFEMRSGAFSFAARRWASSSSVGGSYARSGGQTKQRSAAFKYVLLTLPVITFGLGTWQVARLQEKEAKIAMLEQRTKAPVIELPSSLQFDDAELVELTRSLEYRRVHLRGQFVPDTELLLGPRHNSKGEAGLLVVSAFRREDGVVLLVNRGWIPTAMRNAVRDLLPSGTVDIVGFVRRSERPGIFVPANNVAANRWFSVDVSEMAAAVGNSALPILVDVKTLTPPAEFPSPNQTRVAIPNDHKQYIATWYLLTGCLIVFARGLFRK
jgi:surfeit locus 1 family protein